MSKPKPTGIDPVAFEQRFLAALAKSINNFKQENPNVPVPQALIDEFKAGVTALMAAMAKEQHQ